MGFSSAKEFLYCASLLLSIVVGLNASVISAFPYLGGYSVPCSLGDCSLVSFHHAAFFGGIPIAYFGVVYFFALLILCLLWLGAQRGIFRTLSILVSGAGSVGSIVLIFILVKEVGTGCDRCFVVAISIGVTTIVLGFTSEDMKIQVGKSWGFMWFNLTLLALGWSAVYLAGVWTSSQQSDRRVREIDLRLIGLTPLEMLQGVSYGSVILNRRVVLFIDPYCAICHFVLKEHIERAKHGNEFLLFVRFYPLGGNNESREAAVLATSAGGPPDTEKFLYGLFGKKRLSSAACAQLFEAILGRKPFPSDRDREIVQRDFEVGRKIGIQATPTILMSEGPNWMQVDRVPFVSVISSK